VAAMPLADRRRGRASFIRRQDRPSGKVGGRCFVAKQDLPASPALQSRICSPAWTTEWPPWSARFSASSKGITYFFCGIGVGG
jgi:hypothetical protein